MVIGRVEEAPFECEAVENAGARNGAQQIDAGHVDTSLFDKSFKFGGQLKGIFVETVDEAAVDADTCFSYVFYALHLAVGGVVELLVGMVAAVIEAFNTNQQGAAPRTCEGVEQSGLFAKCCGGLTYPFDLERLEFAKKVVRHTVHRH